MSNTMSQDQQFQQNTFQPANNFNPSASQGNYYFNSNNPSESNPFEASFQGQAYAQVINQNPLHINPSEASNNNRVDNGPSKNNFTRSSTQEPSESGRDNSKDDEDSESRRQRFLERNRIAASKCRQKKKVWMQQLSTEADQAAARNKALQMMVNQLKDEVLVLKNQLLAHRNCNCNVIQQYIQTSGQFAAMNSQQPPNVSLNTDPNHVSLLPPASAGVLDNLNSMPPHHN